MILSSKDDAVLPRETKDDLVKKTPGKEWE